MVVMFKSVGIGCDLDESKNFNWATQRHRDFGKKLSSGY